MNDIKLEEKVDIIFNSFNNEIKAFIIGFLIDESDQTLNQLLNKARKLTFNDESFKRKNVIKNYLDPEREGSLYIFIDEKKIKDNTEMIKTTYMLSDFGKDYGKPLARFLMYSTIKFELPLTSWLGCSQKNGPASMVYILEYINDNPSSKLSDIINNSSLTNYAVECKLKKLERKNIITYSSFYKDDGIKYIGNPNKVSSPNNHFKLPIKIVDFILSFINRNKDPFSYKEIMKNGSFKNESLIQSALRMLERKGYIKAVTQWHGKEKMSDISLTERGRHIINDVINPVIGFIDNDPESVQKVLKKDIYFENIPLAFSIYRCGLKG